MSWEDLDVRGRMFGVFATEGYSPDPIAVFSSEQDAADWMAWQETRGDDSAIVGCDYCIVPVELKGRAWNSYEPIPDDSEAA